MPDACSYLVDAVARPVAREEVTMPETLELAARVTPRGRTTAARLALLGGDDELLSTCEVLRGITSHAEFRLVSHGPGRRAGSTGVVRAR